jgi:hypothetical protein
MFICDYSLQTAVMQVESTQQVTLMRRRNHRPQRSSMAVLLLVDNLNFLWVVLVVQLRQYLTQKQLLWQNEVSHSLLNTVVAK